MLNVPGSHSNSLVLRIVSLVGAQLVFPNVDVVRLLLECGIQVNARNESRSTPLHVAATPYNYGDGKVSRAFLAHTHTQRTIDKPRTVNGCEQLVRMLLDAGAHIDQPNKNDARPITMIADNPVNVIPILRYTTLKCLAATVIAKYKIPYRNQVPHRLEDVVRLHQA